MIRMSGGKVVLRCGSQTFVENRFCTSKRFQFQVSTHVWYLCTLHWLSGRYQYQTERTGLNSTNKYKYCGYKYNIFLRGTASTATGAPTAKFDNENQRKQCEPGLGNQQASCTHTRTRIHKLDFCKLGRHDLPYKWRKKVTTQRFEFHMGWNQTRTRTFGQKGTQSSRMPEKSQMQRHVLSVTFQALKKKHALQYVEVSHRNCNWCCCRRRHPSGKVKRSVLQNYTGVADKHLASTDRSRSVPIKVPKKTIPNWPKLVNQRC